MATAHVTTDTHEPKTLADVAILLESLGLSHIPARRIVINPVPGTATENDLTRLAAGKSPRICELIDGVLVTKTVGLRESMLAMEIVYLLLAYIKSHPLGRISGPDGAMKVQAGRVRVPDVAFISFDRAPAIPGAPIPELAPDLAIEVLSDSNTAKEMADKRRDYFAGGTKLIWEIDPDNKYASVFADPQAPDSYTLVLPNETLDASPVLPGFQIHLATLFSGTQAG